MQVTWMRQPDSLRASACLAQHARLHIVCPIWQTQHLVDL